MRVPFASVNLPGDILYREGWVRHHVMPMQCIRDPTLGPFLSKMRSQRFYIDDFNKNGILLPTLRSQSKLTGLPLHRGGHRNYNARIIAERNAIRVFCEPIRTESYRLEIALSGLCSLQKRVRYAIVTQRVDHVDRVILRGRTDSDLDALIDRLFLANAQ